MDEENSVLNTEELTRDPREVVLSYEQSPRPIEERYMQPTPMPGRRRMFLPPERTEKKKHRGLKIFLICLGAVLGIAAVLTGLYFSGCLNFGSSAGGETEREENNTYYKEQAGKETTIPAYPNGDGTRLRYQETHGEELTIQQVYGKVNPSTVTVMTGLPYGGAVIGTGVIFTENGYILTNAHVLSGGEECYVALADGTTYDVKLVGMDEEKDIAVIKADAHDLPAAEFGDSDALTVGDTVYAIGNPLGVELRGTLTDGIVSAINRDVLVDGVKMTLIQTNAALNNGNSGGPLINVYGQVIGINTMKMGSSITSSVEGLGFAIPIASSAYMINDLIAYGEVHGEAVIGITVDIEATVLPDGTAGLFIEQVTKDGPGDRAGILPGDYVLTADGEQVVSSNDLIRIRRRHDAGDTLHLELMRGEKRYSADVILAENPT